MQSRHQKGFGKKKKVSQDVALQITSMADIFTIILVFLLKSFAGGGLNISPSAGLKLPNGMTEATSPQALTIEISESAVQVENKFIVGLTNFHFVPQDLLQSGIPTSLNEEFEKHRKRQDLIAKSNPDVAVDNKILVVADQRVPYITLKRVLSTAALHGFSEPKLVVTLKE
jgi:biopolymer transport protein ExbD